MTAVIVGPLYETDIASPVAVLGKNETFATAISHVQTEVSALRSEFQRIKVAPMPPDETRAWLRSELQRRHAEAKAQIGYRVERDIMGNERLELMAPDVAKRGVRRCILPGCRGQVGGHSSCMGWTRCMRSIPPDKPRLWPRPRRRSSSLSLRKCRWSSRHRPRA